MKKIVLILSMFGFVSWGFAQNIDANEAASLFHDYLDGILIDTDEITSNYQLKKQKVLISDFLNSGEKNQSIVIRKGENTVLNIHLGYVGNYMQARYQSGYWVVFAHYYLDSHKLHSLRGMRDDPLGGVAIKFSTPLLGQQTNQFFVNEESFLQVLPLKIKKTSNGFTQVTNLYDVDIAWRDYLDARLSKEYMKVHQFYANDSLDQQDSLIARFYESKNETKEIFIFNKQNKKILDIQLTHLASGLIRAKYYGVRWRVKIDYNPKLLGMKDLEYSGLVPTNLEIKVQDPLDKKKRGVYIQNTTIKADKVKSTFPFLAI